VGEPVSAASVPRWQAVGLTTEEYRRVVRLLGREPNDVELGMFGALWSEHCAYKSSKAFLRRLPSQAPWVLLGPGENAGVIDLGDGHALALRIESHNHPSAVEPFQGAATGVGGILRDVFAVGARPVALLDGLLFGDPEDARSRYVASHVVAGIAHYGNAVGVPTVGGVTVFDPAYRTNPLVNVMCLGYLRRQDLVRGAAVGPGNALLLVGNRTGRDGIHGASLLASQAFAAHPEELRPAVQVGDPFVGKLLLEACLELTAMGLLRGQSDLGAAGITSAAAETAARAGTGVVLDLDAVPAREPGMGPYELLLSESQERMLLVVAPEDVPRAEAVVRRWGLEVARVGTVTDDGRMVVSHRGRVVADLPVAALTAEAPRYRRPARRPPRPTPWRPPANEDLEPEEVAEALTALIASPTGASRAWIYRQYDHQVQTNTVFGPGRADAAVLRHRPTGRGVAVALDVAGPAAALDPFGMAARVVAQAVRRVAATGATPRGVTDCLNFGSPEDPHVMGAFVRAVEGMAVACRRLGVPVTGGNVSFYNETTGRAIPPTPAVGVVGLLDDVRHSRPAGFPRAGLAVYGLGRLGRSRLDGSAYQRWRWGLVAGAPLRPAWRTEVALVALLAEAHELVSAHDVAEGGLAVALLECCLLGAEGVGARLQLPRPTGRGAAVRWDRWLFGEGPGRVVVSLDPAAAGDWEARCAAIGLPCHRLGETTDDGVFRLAVGGREVAALELGPLLRRWEEALPSWLA
jgi:phosphoribosylformylglycinamidine synthase II